MKERLAIDARRTAELIASAIRRLVDDELGRKGVVVGLAGDQDTAVVASLCSRALGKDRVLGLLMPEPEQPAELLRLGRVAADAAGIPFLIEDLGPVLRAAGCQRRRDDAIRSVIPDFSEGCTCKLALPTPLAGAADPQCTLVVRTPGGAEKRAPLAVAAYLEIVAASGFKQRARKMFEYYHADRLGYAVAGASTRLECVQGLFVKNGNWAADLNPIAHLYKTQVCELAAWLGLPPEIRERAVPAGVCALPHSLDEPYLALPYEQMDLCLYGRQQGLPAAEVAAAAGLTRDTVEHLYRLIDAKLKLTSYLHRRPLLVQEIPEVVS